MSKTLWNALKLSPAVLGAVILAANTALATDKPESKIGSEETAAADLRSEVLTQTQQAATSSNSTASAIAYGQSAINASVPAAKIDRLPANSTTLAQVSTSERTQPASTLDQLSQYNQDLNSGNQEVMDQVTSVSQLSDVDPTHWAFQALQSLVERYGCIEGYPDRTYRGNRALTRYEFAAGLNACLDRIQELIAAAVSDLPSKEDIATIRRLQEEFAAELATLRGRVDALEARTAELEANQFSTTTKLNAEVIFAAAGVFGDDKAVPSGSPQVNDGVEDNVIFADRVRLNFDTSFSGKDLLRTRLQARNVTPFSGTITGTSMTRLGFDGNEENDIRLDDLYYRFPLGKVGRAFLIANSGEFNDVLNNLHPLFESSGSGAISRFGRFNPIYFINNQSTSSGAAVNLDFGAIGLDFAYLATRANDPNDKNGLFDGEYGALAQLVLFPKGSFNLGLTYAHYYSPATNQKGSQSYLNVTGGTGSAFAQRPFGNVATSADAFGAELNWRISKNFLFGGWFGYTMASAEAGVNKGDDATIINYAVSLGFPDLGSKGNFLGLIGGVPPKVTDNDFGAREDDDTSYHLEAFYRIQATDNISITPGVFVILNPEHNDNNDAIYVGTIRTTFRF